MAPTLPKRFRSVALSFNKWEGEPANVATSCAVPKVAANGGGELAATVAPGTAAATATMIRARTSRLHP